MTAKLSKTNSGSAYLFSRLDEVNMSQYDRVRARAHLERAEAIADALADLFAWFKRLAGTGSYRPTTSAS
jgi:hypothetical protein